MKYVNNKQKLGNYVDTLQEIICSKLCNASKHGSFGKESVMEEVDEDNFMEDEIDNWEDPQQEIKCFVSFLEYNTERVNMYTH